MGGDEHATVEDLDQAALAEDLDRLTGKARSNPAAVAIQSATGTVSPRSLDCVARGMHLSTCSGLPWSSQRSRRGW